MEPIAQARENISLVTKYAEAPSSRFRIIATRSAKEGSPLYAIKVNGIARSFFYSIAELSTEYKEERRVQLMEVIKQSVSCISGLGKEEFILEGRKTDLFNISQRFNQAMQAAREAKGSILKESEISFIEPKDASVKRELAPIFSEVKEEKAEQGKDQPIKVGAHYRYPADVAPHGLEAARIFLCTQAERIASLFCKRYRYFREGVTEADIRTTNAPLPAEQTSPSSYWVGHSTCFISIPVQEQKDATKIKTINVLTDPVEGSLNALLYPRRTQPGRKIEELPAVHVMLLSHNHLDHYSGATIKKLLIMQPTMVVPEGDGNLFTSLGFKNVHEQKWWDKANITLSAGDEKYQISITAVPSHHWAGQGIRGAGSYFVGHVISGASGGGDIYYAGDTARLNEEHIKALRQRFDIRWMYQPGGPDEMRSDMESTHQSSADSLWMHTELFLKKALENHSESKKEFVEACQQNKTILMHTSTFKLGNLHADDTKKSIGRVLKALKHTGEEKAEKYIKELRPYEQRILEELCSFQEQVNFESKEDFSYQELATLLREGVFVPKIGARIDFDKKKDEQKKNLQF